VNNDTTNTPPTDNEFKRFLWFIDFMGPKSLRNVADGIETVCSNAQANKELVKLVRERADKLEAAEASEKTTTIKTDTTLPLEVTGELGDIEDIVSVAKNYVELILMAHSRKTDEAGAAVAAVAFGAVSKLETVVERLSAVRAGALQ